MTKYNLQDGSTVELSKKNFLASGGEGDVYCIGNTTYKVFHDPKFMIPHGKILELQKITHPNIIKPDQLIFANKNPIGFTSAFVSNQGALCQFFPKAFRERHKLSFSDAGELVKKLERLVSSVHSASCLVVDMNEMNFLLSQDLKDLYGIDVSSYQTPSYRATAIMDSIRDRHSPLNHFSEETDWFSFGLLAFQIFIGIHPYKGKHPTLKTLDERMMKNVSVLNSDVSIPSACLPITNIPKNYLNWFTGVFEKGDRTKPPTDFVAAVVVPKQIIAINGSNQFEIKELGTFDGIIHNVWDHYGDMVVYTDKGLFCNSPNRRLPIYEKGYISGITVTGTKKIVTLNINGNSISLNDQTTNKSVPSNLSASQVMCYNNTFYLLSGDKILALSTTDVGIDKIVVGTKLAAQVHEKTTLLFEGVAIQNLMGTCYVSIFPEYGKTYQVRLNELDKAKILYAKYDNRILMIVGFLNGLYHRWIVKFNEEFSMRDIRLISDVTPQEPNFVVLDNGICICLNEDETLEIFSNAWGASKLKKIDDPALSNDMILYKKSGKVLFSKNNKLFQFSLK